MIFNKTLFNRLILFVIITFFFKPSIYGQINSSAEIKDLRVIWIHQFSEKYAINNDGDKFFSKVGDFYLIGQLSELCENLCKTQKLNIISKGTVVTNVSTFNQISAEGIVNIDIKKIESLSENHPVDYLIVTEYVKMHDYYDVSSRIITRKMVNKKSVNDRIRFRIDEYGEPKLEDDHIKHFAQEIASNLHELYGQSFNKAKWYIYPESIKGISDSLKMKNYSRIPKYILDQLEMKEDSRVKIASINTEANAVLEIVLYSFGEETETIIIARVKNLNKDVIAGVEKKFETGNGISFSNAITSMINELSSKLE